MLSLCHTLKEVRPFQNQAEGPLVFLLTFWAMHFLMVLYTFFGKFSFSPYFWEPGGHHFLAEVYFCRNYTTERRLKGRSGGGCGGPSWHSDSIDIGPVAAWLVAGGCRLIQPGLAAVTLTSFQHKTQHQPSSSFLFLSQCTVGLSSLAPLSHGWTFLLLSSSSNWIFI